VAAANQENEGKMSKETFQLIFVLHAHMRASSISNMSYMLEVTFVRERYIRVAAIDAVIKAGI
jgi:hypothetical protein